MTARPGFSLVEILIVIAIAAALAALLVPTIKKAWDQTYITQAKSTLRALKVAIDNFHVDTGYYPNSLEDLIEKPSDPKIAKKWISNYYEKNEILPDPWDHEYQYERTPGKEHPYELYSEGPAGNPISVWQ